MLPGKFNPYENFFDINNLAFFHKIVYENVPISLPGYIEPYTGQGRLRQANLDSLSYICTFTSSSYSSSRSPFYKSFFYRIIYTWNTLPPKHTNCSEYLCIQATGNLSFFNNLSII